ncbi:MAG: hypothetical protein GY861_09835 [bacterium]|nr:hypothetical protein [bacterium]
MHGSHELYNQLRMEHEINAQLEASEPVYKEPDPSIILVDASGNKTVIQREGYPINRANYITCTSLYFHDIDNPPVSAEHESDEEIFSLDELVVSTQISEKKRLSSEEPKRIPGENGVRKEVYKGKNLRRVAWGETHKGQPTDRSLRYHRQNPTSFIMPEKEVEVDLTPIRNITIGENSNIPIKFTRADGTYVKIRDGSTDRLGREKPIANTKATICTKLYQNDLRALPDDSLAGSYHAEDGHYALEDELIEDGMAQSLKSNRREERSIDKTVLTQRISGQYRVFHKYEKVTAIEDHETWYGKLIFKGELEEDSVLTGIETTDTRQHNGDRFEGKDHRQKRMLNYRNGAIQNDAARDELTMQDGGEENLLVPVSEASLDNTVFSMIDMFGVEDNCYGKLKDAVTKLAEQADVSFGLAGLAHAEAVSKIAKSSGMTVEGSARIYMMTL